MISRRPWMSVGGDRGGTFFLALLAAVAILVPLLNLAVPASSSLHLSTYVLTLLGKIAILVLIILFIQKRPRGMFALKGRAVEA